MADKTKHKSELELAHDFVKKKSIAQENMKKKEYRESHWPN